MVISFGGFSLWAFRAPLAAAVISQGSFVATGQNKIVQHLEGGIIKEIMIREGDRVTTGQLLVRLEATEARLLALYQLKPSATFGSTLTDIQGDYEVASIVDGQRLAFQVSQSALEDDLSLLQRNYDALEVRRVGYAVQLDAHQRQLDLLSEELGLKKSLLDEGLIRRSEMFALRRVNNMTWKMAA